MDLDMPKENIQQSADGGNVPVIPANYEILNAKRKELQKVVEISSENLFGYWFDFIVWIEQNFPDATGSDKRLFDSILRECIEKFEHNDLFKQDQRMIKLYIKYNDLQSNPEKRFAELWSRGIGTKVADFYISWALYYDLGGNFDKAEEIMRKGLEAKAAPFEKLQQAHLNFQCTMSQRRLYKDTTFQRNFAAALQEKRQALTSLRQHTKKLESLSDATVKNYFDIGSVQIDENTAGPSNICVKVLADRNRNIRAEADKGSQPDSKNKTVQQPEPFYAKNLPQEPWYVKVCRPEDDFEGDSFPCYPKTMLYPKTEHVYSPEELQGYYWFNKRQQVNSFTERMNPIWSNELSVGPRIYPYFCSKNLPQENETVPSLDSIIVDLETRKSSFYFNIDLLYPKGSEERQIEEILFRNIQSGKRKIRREGNVNLSIHITGKMNENLCVDRNLNRGESLFLSNNGNERAGESSAQAAPLKGISEGGLACIFVESPESLRLHDLLPTSHVEESAVPQPSSSFNQKMAASSPELTSSTANDIESVMNGDNYENTAMDTSFDDVVSIHNDESDDDIDNISSEIGEVVFEKTTPVTSVQRIEKFTIYEDSDANVNIGNRSTTLCECDESFSSSSFDRFLKLRLISTPKNCKTSESLEDIPENCQPIAINKINRSSSPCYPEINPNCFPERNLSVIIETTETTKASSQPSEKSSLDSHSRSVQTENMLSAVAVAKYPQQPLTADEVLSSDERPSTSKMSSTRSNERMLRDVLLWPQEESGETISDDDLHGISPVKRKQTTKPITLEINDSLEFADSDKSFLKSYLKKENEGISSQIQDKMFEWSDLEKEPSEAKVPKDEDYLVDTKLVQPMLEGTSKQIGANYATNSKLAGQRSTTSKTRSNKDNFREHFCLIDAEKYQKIETSCRQKILEAEILHDESIEDRTEKKYTMFKTKTKIIPTPNMEPSTGAIPNIRIGRGTSSYEAHSQSTDHSYMTKSTATIDSSENFGKTVTFHHRNYYVRKHPVILETDEDAEETDEYLSSGSNTSVQNFPIADVWENTDVHEHSEIIDPDLLSNGNPFDPKLIEKLLQSINIWNYVEKLPNCTKLNRLPKLRYGNKLEINDGRKLYILKSIGEGSYGHIFNARCERTGKLYALKEQNPPNYWEYYILLELKVRMTNPDMIRGFMQIEFAVIGENASVFISEYSRYGSLTEVLNKVKKATNKKMNEFIVMILAHQMLSIIDNLHSIKIIHADIKADNFLLMSKLEYDSLIPAVQLIDFGVSIDMSLFRKGQEFSYVSKIEKFRCVEMRENRSWTYQNDLYGLAGVIHALLFGSDMEIQKKNFSWTIKRPIPRYFNKILWSNIFDNLLNIADCNSMPNLQKLRSILYAEITADETFTRNRITEFNLALN